VVDRPASPTQSLKPTVEDQVDESESAPTPSSATLSSGGVVAAEKLAEISAVAEKTKALFSSGSTTTAQPK